MSLFLDSHVLLWWLTEERLSVDIFQRLRFEPQVFVSIVSPWELWIKAASGKLPLPLPPDFEDGLTSKDAFTLVAPTLEDARTAAALPLIHRDPFDRMIVAQAINRQSTLITADTILGRYGVAIIHV